MKHSMEINGQFVETRPNAARFLHPSDALLNDVSLPIGQSVEPDSTVAACSFVALVRDDRFDPPSAKPIPNALHAIPFIRGQFLRTCSRSPDPLRNRDAFHHRFKLRRFVDLSSRDLDGQRCSATVSNQVELRSKPASAAAQSVVRRFVGVRLDTFLLAPAAARAARTLAPSIHQRSQSMRPRSSSLICRASTISAKRPSRLHFAKWWYTVCQGPNRSGRSRQGAPVCRIQKIPLSSVRRSRGGRPVRATLGGKNASINDHCSSMSSWRFMITNLPVVIQGYRYEGSFSDRA